MLEPGATFRPCASARGALGVRVLFPFQLFSLVESAPNSSASTKERDEGWKSWLKR